MVMITVNRAKGNVTVVRRSDLNSGTTFQYLENGKATGAIFANFGKVPSLGKFYSVGVDGKHTGKLCGSTKGETQVAIVGNWSLEANLVRKGTEKKMTRNKLESGDVFQVPRPKAEAAGTKPCLYLHLGRVANDRKVLSFNLNTKELAVGTKLNGAVAKVGDTELLTAAAA